MNDDLRKAMREGRDLAPASSLEDARARIRLQGAAYVPAEVMALETGPAGRSAWATFAASWSDLPFDRYMADGGTYRRRRFSVFELTPAGRVTLEGEPHYQDVAFNALNGGVERWYEPLAAASLQSPILSRLIDMGERLATSLAPRPMPLRVEAHQFRIEACRFQSGRPTPEGLHRDGVLLALILFVSRQGVRGGVTRITDRDGREIAAVQLRQPLEALWLDDSKVLHETTPVELAGSARQGHRDVLVLTFQPCRSPPTGLR